MITMAAIDAVWLKVMFSKFYNPQIGHLLAETPKLIPAILFYIIFASALTFFVILPAISNDSSLLKTFVIGGFFGLVAYATYDLTSHALIKDWPAIVSVVDIAWGAFLTGTVSICTVAITKFFS